MARIRTIKPDFFRHGGLFDAEQETGLPLRVAFAGLWTACDREGRFVWKPRELKLDALPFDNVDFSRVLDALATRGHITRYRVNGTDYGFIPSWHSHQVINNRESPSNLPEPTQTSIESATCTREARVDDARPAPLVHAQAEGKGKEGEEEGKEIAQTTAVVSASAEQPTKPAASAPRTSSAKEPAPTSATWDAYADAYRSRYGVDPVRNAKVNGQLSQLVARIGGDEAPPVARFFVGLQDAYYVRRMHPVDDLLSNAEKLRTQWATNGRARPNQAAERGAALERALGFTNEDVIDA